MFEKREECPVCGHLTNDNFLICTDHTVSGESFALVKCQTCTHVYTNPKPTEERLGQYYKSDSYISHTNQITSPIHIAYKLARTYTLRQKEHLIRTLNKSSVGSLLDFGCGTGQFIHHCSRKGWNVTGIEPDKQARNQAKKIDVNVTETLDQVEQTYNCITAWHVLEHVSNPVQTLKDLKNKLVDGGHIIIAVPNHNSFDATYYREFWAGYDVPRHLSHFSQKSMRYLADKSKLRIVSIKPMFLDAYYVSILSHRYQTGKSSILAPLQIGKKSNATAKLTGEYSSLIYILTK